jgi:spermidine/putrescine-binding protein
VLTRKKMSMFSWGILLRFLFCQHFFQHFCKCASTWAAFASATVLASTPASPSQGTSLLTEKKFRILCYEGYVNSEELKKFQATANKVVGAPVKLEFVNIVDEDQIFENARSGAFDLVSPGIDIYEDERFQLITKKLLAPFDVSKIPNYSSLFSFRQKMEFQTKAGKVYGVPYASGMHGLLFRTNAQSKPPANLRDILSAKGTFSITNYPAHNAYLAALMTDFKGDDVFRYENLVKNDRFLKVFRYLVTNAKSIMPGADRAEDMMGDDFALGFGFSFRDLALKGEKWQMAHTADGHIGWLDSWSIPKQVQLEPWKWDLAHAFVNHTISPDYQYTMVVKGISSEPANEKTLALLKPSDLESLPQLKNLAQLEKERVYLKPLTIRQRNGFRVLYNRYFARRTNPPPTKSPQ